MRSTILVYSLGSLLFVSAGYLAYEWFFEADSSEELVVSRKQDKSRSSVERAKSSRDRTAKSSEEVSGVRESLWTDEEFTAQGSQDRFGRNLKEFVEIRSQTRKLHDQLQSGQIYEVEENLLSLIERNPNVPEYQALLGDVYLHLTQYDRAEGPVRRLVELDPKNSFARLTLADIVAVRGRPDESLPLIDDVLRENPSDPTALKGLVTVSKLKSFESFLESKNRVQQIFQESPNREVGKVLVEAHIDAGEWQEATQLVEELSELFPQDEEILAWQEQMQFGLGEGF